MSGIGFDFNQGQQNKKQGNQKGQNFSIDWDNFDAPQSHTGSISNSDIFQKSQKSSQKSANIKQQSQRQFDDSRDIMDISILDGAGVGNTGFRFQSNDFRDSPTNNQRYTRMQELLQAAKKNSLEQFYKNIDRQNKAYSEEPQKFINYKQFKNYVKDLKAQKRQKEDEAFNKQIGNPFGSMNSNKIINQKSNIDKPTQISKPQYNFAKKITQPSLGKGGFLPQEYTKQYYDTQPVENRYKNQNRLKKDALPQKAKDYSNQEEATDFFQVSTKKSKTGAKSQKQKQQKVQLNPIREEKHNSFDKTFQEQKLDNLFKNYQYMRKDFEQLMGELKHRYQGQQKIVDQLRKMKDQKKEIQIREERQARREKKDRQNQQRNKKLDTIQDQITKIKSNEKDILYSQIIKKIEQLQSVVWTALEEVKQEKEAKLIPQVVNYFCDHDRNLENIDREFQKDIGYLDADLRLNTSERKDDFINFGKEQFEFMRSSHNQKFNEEKEKDQQNDKRSPPMKANFKNNFQHQPSRSQSGKRLKDNSQNQNICSPLDLQFHNHNFSQDMSYSHADDNFDLEQFAEQFFPRQIQTSNKNLRNCLTQKNSVVFQSFDFHVSARFSVLSDQIRPIFVAIKVNNKCSIDMYDVHVVTYGPQGPGVQTEPSNIFEEELKRGNSLNFQVSLDKICLEDNGFSIQIWYRTDRQQKKKINFKVMLPLVQLIRPEFIYEQKFKNDWSSLANEQFLRPKRLDGTYFRSHQDLKLVLPFIELTEVDPDSFSYGLMFRYPKAENIFYIKIKCFVSGRALVQLRSQRTGERKLKQQILNALNFVLFSSM